MREETHPTKTCAICKLPITPEQWPFVPLSHGDEAHSDCWDKFKQSRYSAREKARQTKICIVCKLPITRIQRPSVQLENGDDVHVDCWTEYKQKKL